MATARPFAYNPSQTSIPGIELFGYLSVGPTGSGVITGLTTWNGPDEDLGYVIAKVVPSNTQPTPIPGIFASVGFYRSSTFSDVSFLYMVNRVLNSNYVNAQTANNYLISNGYWTNYPAGSGDVTPNPTPNWADILDPQTSAVKTVAVQQIEGITSTINLEVSRSGDVFKIYYKIDNSAPAWTNGGGFSSAFTSWTEITSFPVIINVSNNQYVSFGCGPLFFGQTATATITVKNNSDSATTLDTFTATVLLEE